MITEVMYYQAQKEIFNQSGNDFLMNDMMKIEKKSLNTGLLKNIIQGKMLNKDDFYYLGKELMKE
jgi:hypothetical protein